MDEAECRRRMGAVPVARLATVAPDGHPHLVPVTFALDGDLVHIAVDHKPKRTRRLRRLDNIAAEPRVALLADHYEDDWDRLWWVRADGLARVVSEAGAMAGPLDLLAARYRPYRENRPAGPVITIEVTRWSGWIYAPGRES